MCAGTSRCSLEVLLLMAYRDEATADPNTAFKAVDFVTDVSTPRSFYYPGRPSNMRLGASAF